MLSIVGAFEKKNVLIVFDLIQFGVLLLSLFQVECMTFQISLYCDCQVWTEFEFSSHFLRAKLARFIFC